MSFLPTGSNALLAAYGNSASPYGASPYGAQATPYQSDATPSYASGYGMNTGFTPSYSTQAGLGMTGGGNYADAQLSQMSQMMTVMMSMMKMMFSVVQQGCLQQQSSSGISDYSTVDSETIDDSSTDDSETDDVDYSGTDDSGILDDPIDDSTDDTDDSDSSTDTSLTYDSFKTPSNVWKRSTDQAHWDADKKKYTTGGDDGNRASHDPEVSGIVDFSHRNTKSHGVKSDGWQAIKDNFALIDADNNNNINANELFTAISNGSLDKLPDAKHTAMILATSPELMNTISTAQLGNTTNRIVGDDTAVENKGGFTSDQAQQMVYQANTDDADKYAGSSDSFLKGEVAQFKDGTYKQTDLASGKIHMLSNYGDVVGKDAKMIKKGYQAILDNWNSIDKSDSGGSISSQDLYNALLENKGGNFTKGTAAQQAALYLSISHDELNKLDGADHNGLISKEDFQRLLAAAPDALN